MTDDQALARFERLFQTQPKPDKPWKPVLPYDIATRRQVEGQQPTLIRDVFNPATVLDYGCGAGYLVAFLAELGLRVWGYEPSTEHGPMVPPYVEHLVSYKPFNPSQGRFNLVICREVLEHVPLVEVRPLVSTLCALSSKFVYVTTRFAQQPDHLLAVDTADALDPTHVTMLSQPLLRLLFVLEGFTQRADLEQRMDWQGQGRCLVYERP